MLAHKTIEKLVVKGTEMPHRLKKRRGILFKSFSGWSANWGRCQLNLTTTADQFKSNVVFLEREKTGVPGEKPLGAEHRTNKLEPHVTPSREIEPGFPGRKASALRHPCTLRDVKL